MLKKSEYKSTMAKWMVLEVWTRRYSVEVWDTKESGFKFLSLVNLGPVGSVMLALPPLNGCVVDARGGHKEPLSRNLWIIEIIIINRLIDNHNRLIEIIIILK